MFVYLYIYFYNKIIYQAESHDETKLDQSSMSKINHIELLLKFGAKLSSKTWQAADGKPKIALKLIKKLCADGYFLQKVSCLS